jgi:D-cysteine desulfhydrase
MKDATIPYPESLELARRPTPLQKLHRYSEKLGVELFIKRDDLTGMGLSGNKIRKLEFVLADALAQKADVVLTCGGAQSNHGRATAVAAAMQGLGCRLILRTTDPSQPPPTDGNLLLDRMAGAEIVWITPEEYRRRDEIFARESEALKKTGKRPYVIPEGASNALGAWGYIRAAGELKSDLARLPGGDEKSTAIIFAAGSGGTGAGLILGTRLHEIPSRVVGINVCDDRDYFVRVIGEICEEVLKTYELDLPFSREQDIEIIDGYVGRGYALSRPEELDLLMDVSRTEGIFLDSVYTGKAFYGMVSEIKQDPKCFGDRIVFIHTGGIFGLFDKVEEISSVMESRKEAKPGKV